jgi:hypothetical protein
MLELTKFLIKIGPSKFAPRFIVVVINNSTSGILMPTAFAPLSIVSVSKKYMEGV